MLSSFAEELEAFRAFADALPIFIWMQDGPECIPWVNAAFAAYLGLDGRTASLETQAHVVFPEDLGHVSLRTRDGIESQRPFAYDLRMRPARGPSDGYRWYTIRMMPLRNGPALMTWVGAALDVHDARIRELDARDIASAAQRYREVTENVPGVVWSTDASGAMNYANAAWLDTFGVTHEQAQANAFADVIHPDDLKATLSEWARAMEQRQAYQFVSRMRLHNGEYHAMLVHAVPRLAHDGGFLGYVGMTVDIQSEVDRSEARMAYLRRFLDTLPAIAWSSTGDEVTWYNARWTEYTGATLEDAGGNTWSRLIHPDDLAGIRAALRHTAETGEALAYEYRLLGKDQQYRWHLARRSPLIDDNGQVVSYIGTATDIERQKRIEEQLRFSAQVGEAFNTAQDSRTLVARIANVAVPAVADYAIFWLANRRGELTIGAARHCDDAKQALLTEYVRLYPPREGRMANRPTVRDIDDDALVAWSHDERQLAMLRELAATSIIAVPIETTEQFFGTMCFSRIDGSPAYTQDDLRFMELLGRRLATALENIRIYERERNIADTFQQAALPKSLPALPGLALHAVYRAAEDEARVGGDWYDAFVLDDGRLVVAVGDVTGKGLEAAITMATVRQNMRLAAYEGHDPAGILFAVDRALRRDTPERLVTSFVGIIDRQSSRMTYANAGHSWPVMRHSDGRITTLGGSDPPLGLLFDRPVTRAVTMPSNALLFLYTDGLIEASRDVIQGERWLHEALQKDAIVHASDPARYLFESLIARSGGQRDDVAVLSVATGRSIHWSFNAEDAMAAQGARSAFVRILRQSAAGDSDFYGAELIFGELIGNVVRHAPGQIDIALDWTGPAPILHVLDSGLGFDAPDIMLPEDEFSESSRGLFLIAAIGSDFSVERLPGHGMHARVTLPVRRA